MVSKMSNRDNEQFDTRKPAGIYIHVPFCLKKCAYCDFYSITDISLKPGFVDALIREMAMSRDHGLKFDSIYIGGGTPSLLSVSEISRIVDALARNFKMSASSEITMEINPGTIDQEKLKGFRMAGINRINIGVQSFSDKNLSFLGRIHTVKDAASSIKWCRKTGFDNIGLDLIYAIPGQTKRHWLENVSRALDYCPDHLSCYILTYEPGTPLMEHYLAGRHKPLPEETIADLFHSTSAFLNSRGFIHYEISNFARTSDKKSRHNLKYWSFAPYLGFGPAAHSYLHPRRFWNQPEVTEYIEHLLQGKSPAGGMEILDREKQVIEAIYMSLRTADGISLSDFNRRFQMDFCHTFRTVLAELEKDGFAFTAAGKCRLSEKGMAFLDAITRMFICHDF